MYAGTFQHRLRRGPGLEPILRPVYTCRHRVCLCQVVLMVTDHLTERIGSVPNLPFKQSVSIDTMLNFDGDEHGEGTCKQAFMQNIKWIQGPRSGQ